MRKLYSIPLIFLFLAAAIGLFLRGQFIAPTPGVRYQYFLHAHSHVMFLGWVLNVLFLSFTQSHLSHVKQQPFKLFFLLLQLLVVAMTISFPIQGYGPYSIIFSTLHTIAVMIFIVIFFRETKGQQSVSLWFARVSLIFFLISTAGPFSLGYLMANGMGDTMWYDFSIYYYLHFQYNGFFLFGVFSLFYQLLEKRKVVFDSGMALAFGRWMAAACVPAYTLSTLFVQPGLFFNGIGALAAIIQLLALAVLHRELKQLVSSLRLIFRPVTLNALKLVFTALIIRSVLQFFSAHPEIAELAYTLRPIVIAYLHLVLVGIVTFFLLAWYLETELVSVSAAKTAMVVLFIGFAGSELCLIVMPWWSQFVGGNLPSSVVMIFSFSVLLVLGTLIFLFAFRPNGMTKISFHLDPHHQG